MPHFVRVLSLNLLFPHTSHITNEGFGGSAPQILKKFDVHSYSVSNQIKVRKIKKNFDIKIYNSTLRQHNGAWFAIRFETDSAAPIENVCIIAGKDQEMRAQPVT